jgi:hypothetical protein
VLRFVISRILNHFEEKDITSVYDRYSYDAERKATMEFWNRQLSAILVARSGESIQDGLGTVISLVRLSRCDRRRRAEEHAWKSDRFTRSDASQSPPTHVRSISSLEGLTLAYRCHQWQANLRILNIREIKTVPYVPRSHPVIERLMGTVRRECLDRMLSGPRLISRGKLVEFQRYSLIER